MDYVALIFPLFIVIVMVFIIYKVIVKKRLPSNKYTPYDELMKYGKKDEDEDEENKTV